MYQKIMIPLDGSKLAECVLPHVEALARGCDIVDVALVRAVQPLQLTVGDFALEASQVARVDAESKAEAAKYLDEVAKRLSAGGARVTTEVLVGKDTEALADYATNNAFDLIVIATHGRSGIKRWVWGSVADRLLRAACVPVLMVRAPGCAPGF
jgi:nucleotide-binding universal stress UspA family protein